MRHPRSILLIPVLLLAAPAVAQDALTPLPARFMMLNQNVCSGDDLDRVMEIVAEATGPILSELKAEGMIEDWGLLDHAWGDEYNFNWFIVAENHRAWLDAWNAMIQRTQERHPGLLTELGRLCTLHKDNLYTLRRWE